MNMRKAIYTLLLLPLMALTGCVNDGLEPCPSDTHTGYLELTVTTGGTTASRANPTGGEEGDGLEHGRNNENTIHNLTIFVYADKDGLGLDSETNAIVWSKYVAAAEIDTENPDFPLDRIYNVRIPLADTDFQYFRPVQGTTLRAAVVANAGDLTSQHTSVGNLRWAICEAPAWTQTDGTIADQSDYFVMSSAFNGAKRTDNYKRDGVINIAQSNTEGIVYSSDITLERVAARIDLEFSTETYNANGTLEYTVKGLDNNNKRTVTLLNTIPVNLMQNHSYLFKHLSGGVDNLGRNDDQFIAADETVDNIGVPTNYVITPDFFDKAGTPDYSNWYGQSSAEWLSAQDVDDVLGQRYPMSSFGAAFNIESDWNTPAGARAITITYSNENTQSKTEHDSRYITGLLLRTQYNPGKVYTSGDITQEPVVYTTGNDFYLFRTVADNVLESQNLYFATQAALDAYVATLPAGGRYETAHYPGGICYYNIWIKHANVYPDGNLAYDEDIPMEYGIVRNNIYRISLNFNGIGQPTPEINEPHNITSRIYVIKWNFRQQPEIIM